MYSAIVASPATHRYRGGDFAPPVAPLVAPSTGNASDTSTIPLRVADNANAVRYLNHTLRGADGGCVRQVAQDKFLRAAKFDMDSGATPEAWREIVDAPNRAVMRWLLAKKMEEECGVLAAEELESDDDDLDEDGFEEVKEEE